MSQSTNKAYDLLLRIVLSLGCWLAMQSACVSRRAEGVRQATRVSAHGLNRISNCLQLIFAQSVVHFQSFGQDRTDLGA